MESNKLIAEFMGFPKEADAVDDRTIAYYVGESILWTDNTDNENEYDVFHPDDMQFHKSWDWLMPVVEKIESLRDANGNAYRFTIDMCNAQIEETNIEILGGRFKLDTTHKAVVEFIKTYNDEQNKA